MFGRRQLIERTAPADMDLHRFQLVLHHLQNKLGDGFNLLRFLHTAVRRNQQRQAVGTGGGQDFFADAPKGVVHNLL